MAKIKKPDGTVENVEIKPDGIVFNVSPYGIHLILEGGNCELLEATPEEKMLFDKVPYKFKKSQT